MKSAPIGSFVKNKSIKDKFNNKRKLSIVFDKTMSNLYETNAFPTIPYAVIEIHEKNQATQQ